jgi:hypothetical protein
VKCHRISWWRDSGLGFIDDPTDLLCTWEMCVFAAGMIERAEIEHVPFMAKSSVDRGDMDRDQIN